MDKKQAEDQQHLSVTALQLELRGGLIVCVNERGVQAIGPNARALAPSMVASIIRQAMNSAFQLRRLDLPYPDESSEVEVGSLRRMLVVLSDRRAAPDRCTLIRFLSRDGYSVSRIAASSEAISNRDLYPRHMRSIYLYAYNDDLERVREDIDTRMLPVLARAKAAWEELR